MMRLLTDPDLVVLFILTLLGLGPAPGETQRPLGPSDPSEARVGPT